MAANPKRVRRNNRDPESTHKEILQAALEVLAKDGPESLNVTEVARRARTVSPELCVVFMTGYSDISRVLPEEFGEDAILLRKPFRRNELARALSRALGRDADARGGA